MVVFCFVVSRLYENVGRIVCAGQMVVNLQYWGFDCLVDVVLVLWSSAHESCWVCLWEELGLVVLLRFFDGLLNSSCWFLAFWFYGSVDKYVGGYVWNLDWWYGLSGSMYPNMIDCLKRARRLVCSNTCSPCHRIKHLYPIQWRVDISWVCSSNTYKSRFNKYSW